MKKVSHILTIRKDKLTGHDEEELLCGSESVAAWWRSEVTCEKCRRRMIRLTNAFDQLLTAAKLILLIEANPKTNPDTIQLAPSTRKQLLEAVRAWEPRWKPRKSGLTPDDRETP